MGLLDFFGFGKRVAAEPPPAPPAVDYSGALKQAQAQNKLPPSAVSTLAKGVSGTANFFGDVLSESNTRLIHEQAFGQPGARTWGEWEKILLTDPAVHMGVEFVAAQLRDARVDVTPANEESMPDRKLAEAQADFCRWNLLEALEPSWTDVIQQMTRGPLVFGFSLHERVFGTCAHRSLPGGSGYKLVRLAERLPVSVHVNGWLEKDGDLHQVKQQGVTNDGTSTWVTPTLDAKDLLLISWNRRGNNYLGHSAFRSVWYLCKIREELARLIGVTYQREGAGIPVAFATDKGNELAEEQRAEFQQLLANLVYHENASAVLPAGWDMKWVFSPAANKGHVIEAYDALGLVILQQVQAQQLHLGTGSTGSRAVGDTHSASSDAFVQGVAATIEGVLNGVGARAYTGLVRQLVDINWGPQAAYPRLGLTLKQAKLAPSDFANTVKTLRDAKAIVVWTLEDENASREKVGLGKVTEAQWDDAETKRTEAAAAMAQSLKQGGEDDEDDDKPKPPGKPPPFKRASAGAFTPRRALRPAEVHCAWGEISSYLDDGKERFERGAKPLVVAMLSKTLPAMKAAMSDGVIDHDDVAALPLEMGELEAFVGKWLNEVRREGYRQVAGEKLRANVLPRFAASEEEKEDERPEPPDEPPPPQEKLLDAQKKQLLRRIEARLRAELEDAAIDVDRTDGDEVEVVGDVTKRVVEGKTLQADAGGVITKAFNLGREEFAEEYADAIESVELSALLDDGTCGPCESMDGTEFDFGSSEYERNTPPLRDCEGRNRCRCLFVFQWK